MEWDPYIIVTFTKIEYRNSNSLTSWINKKLNLIYIPDLNPIQHVHNFYNIVSNYFTMTIYFGWIIKWESDHQL